MFGDGDQPKTTGSIATPVAIERPLPSTLAYSDAAKIGEAANAVLAQASGMVPQDWVNAATGSSGTIETVALDAPPAQSDCRPFSTTVTSIGGVHQYSGAICERSIGPPSVRIDERSPVDRT